MSEIPKVSGALVCVMWVSLRFMKNQCAKTFINIGEHAIDIAIKSYVNIQYFLGTSIYIVC